MTTVRDLARFSEAGLKVVGAFTAGGLSAGLVPGTDSRSRTVVCTGGSIPVPYRQQSCRRVTDRHRTGP